MAYFAISFGSFVLLLNRNGIIISVLMSSPNTHAFPSKTASVANGEFVDFGGDGISEKLMMRVVTAVEMRMLSYCSSPYPLQSNYKYLSGLAILPSIAEAAAVAGDERYTLDESAPILPTKFLEDEDIHISSSPRAPRCVPTQAPHVAFVNTAPDSRYTSTYPRRIASSYTLTEAGVTMHLVF